MGRRVLIVDDDPSLQLVIGDALAGAGYEITVVDDGSEVMERVAHIPFELVVLDLYMPGMNGFEVLRQLREPEHGLLPARRTPPSVRVLVITAQSDPATLSFALKCGADLCLPKPFDLTDLWQAAHRLLAHPLPH